MSTRIDFLKTIRDFSDRRFVLSAFIVVALSAVEFSGLVLLLPLLHTVGIEPASPGGPAGTALNALKSIGLPETLAGLLGVYFLLATAQTLLKINISRLNARIHSDFLYFIRQRLHRALIRAEWSVFLGQRGSDIVRVLTTETALAGSGATWVIGFVSSLLQVSVQIVVAWWISPLVTATSLAAGVVVVFMIRPLTMRVRAEGRASQLDRGTLAAEVTDHVNGLKLAKAHGAEFRCAELFDMISKSIGRRHVDIALNQSWATASFNLGATVSLCGFLWFAVTWQGVRGAELALLAVVFMRLASRVMSIQALFQRLAMLLPAFEATEEFKTQWERAAEPDSDSSDRSELSTGLTQQLELVKVSYAYPTSNRETIDSIDLNIPAGKTTAICGLSGAGKSTLADLCMGLIHPSTGTVAVDGRTIDRRTVRSWRKSIGYVPQDVFLFNDTLRNNLLFLADGASDEEIWHVLDATASREWVERLPDQLETIVGDRGVRLSGGERQRIALARTLLRKPTLLVLDEATSALDSENERVIRATIGKLHGQVTILIIAHRLSTIRHADNIAVMEAGRIVQSGTWSQLQSERTGPMARMIDAARL